MDVLKRELQRKRQQIDADFGGRKVIRRAEIEAREIQRLRVAERERLLQKQRQQQQLRSSQPAASSSASSSSSLLPPSAVADESAKADRTDGSKESSIPREEVVRRLQLLRQPATLFGEDDAARLRRLHDVLEDPAALADVDAGEIGEGQTNDFLRDIQALCAKAAAKPKAVGTAERSDGAKEEREEVPFEELCDEDKIMAFFQRLLSEWSQEVDEMPEAERRTARGKAVVATCKQCARYLDPLFKLCKKKALPDDVQRALLDVVWCCLRRDYLAATDNYIKLAIAVRPREDPHQQRGPRDERRDDQKVLAVRETAHDLLPAKVPHGPVQVGRVQQSGQWQRPAGSPGREERERFGRNSSVGGRLVTKKHQSMFRKRASAWQLKKTDC